MEQHVDFAALAAAADCAVPRPSRERGGRPPFPTELMVRVLLIQQLFNLSDEQMEFQLVDRLSFQRFVGLRGSSQILDRTTIWTFKERLIQAGASESIFDEANRQLSMQGYMARGGKMIDASIMQTPKQSINKEEKSIVAEKAMPADWSPAKRLAEGCRCPLDQEAWKILLWLQALGQRRQSLKGHSQDQDHQRQRTRHAAL